jgi:hypothetical protein
MSFRVAVCGGTELAAAAGILGLTPAEGMDAQLALVDLRDPAGVARAASFEPNVPRVLIATEAQAEILAALGLRDDHVATSCEPAVLGPAVAAALPVPRRATRSILLTAARGGVGRSLLAANIARRLSGTHSVLALDLTGAGPLSWWLGASPATWRDLESLTDELSAEHLAVVATEVAPGLRVAGGPPCAPSPRLGLAALRAGLDLAEVVLIDGPTIAEDRTRGLVEAVDRVLLPSYDDPVSLAALAAADLPNKAWLIASQSAAESLAGYDVFRALPRADGAIAAAAARRGAVGGALGDAYDEIAELLMIDTT